MASLKEVECRSLIQRYPIKGAEFLEFVETGTHLGQTLTNLHSTFLNLYSVEVSEFYFNKAKKNLNYKNIQLYLGDSAVVLPNIIPLLKYNAVFFLDGHWSSGNTGRGEKDCPLIEEVTEIVKEFNNKSIIIIDDYRLFGTNRNENWSDINEKTLLSICDNKLIDYFVENDRLIIYLK